MQSDAISQSFALECFEYRGGTLVWKDRPLSHFANEKCRKVFNSRQAGTVAGTLISGYMAVNFKQRRVSVHRLIFLMHHGYWPARVDHINGDTLDNRIENLRAATHQQNLMNSKTSCKNTSGRKGVSYHASTKKWAAYIRMDGKMKHLGVFKKFEDAAAARRAAEIKVYGDFANER